MNESTFRIIARMDTQHKRRYQDKIGTGKFKGGLQIVNALLVGINFRTRILNLMVVSVHLSSFAPNPTHKVLSFIVTVLQ